MLQNYALEYLPRYFINEQIYYFTTSEDIQIYQTSSLMLFIQTLNLI